LVSDELRFGVKERVLFNGLIERAIDMPQVNELVERLRGERRGGL
jgi:hypothetical protein